MARPVHPKKEIEQSLKHAEQCGWRIEVGGGHAWGRIYCPYNNADCRCGEFCITSIWSTPKNAGNHGRAVRRVVDKCALINLATDQVKAMEYIFTLKYQLAVDDCDPVTIVERLGAAGCNDALVGTGQAGRVALEFTREADSATAALQSALEDVRRAIPGAKLTEAGPDYVGLTDVADMLAMSRQNLRKLMLVHAASFPPPVHEGSALVWRLADLLVWLTERGYTPDAALVETAHATRQVNLAKDAGQQNHPMQQVFRPLV